MISIKLLGTGCTRCKELERLCNEIECENNLNAESKLLQTLRIVPFVIIPAGFIFNFIF